MIRPTAVSTGEFEANALVAAGSDVLQPEPDAGEDDDRERQPVADRQGHRVHAEVVAELVGEHPGELVLGQLLDGERRDHDEVAATGEGVELVERQHASMYRSVGRSFIWAMRRHSGSITAQLVRGRLACPEQGVSTSAWIGRTNSSTAATQ